MPGYREHLLGGAAAFGIGMLVMSSCCTNLFMGGEWLLCALAGSLFPDIDIKSKGQKLFYRLLLMLFFYFILYERLDIMALLAVCAMAPLLVNHRGLFHKGWFIVALPLGVWFAMQQFFPAYKTALLFDTGFFIIGALSHLILDLGVRRTLRL